MKRAILFFAILLFISPGLEAGELNTQSSHPLRTFTFEQRGKVIARLYRLGLENKPEYIKTFCDALRNKDVKVREAAIAQLVFTHDKTAIKPIVGVMKDKSTLVRRCAIASLERIGSKKAIPALKEALTYVPPEIKKQSQEKLVLPREEYFNRLAAALALYRLGNNDGTGTVLEILKASQDKPVLTMALKAVMIMNLKEAIPECIRIAQGWQFFGEDSPGFYALRALRIVGDASYASQITALAMEKINTPGGFVKMESLALMAKFGDQRVLPVFRKYLASKTWVEHKYWAVKGLERLKPKDAASLIVEYILGSGARPNTYNLLAFKEGASAVAALGNKDLIGTLENIYNQYSEPTDHFVYRLYLAWVMARLGDEEGFGHLLLALKHKDAAVRRLSAKLLGELKSRKSRTPLVAALKVETERSTFETMRASLAQLGPLSAAIAKISPPAEPPVPVDNYRKPRYINFIFDDCATIEGVERIVDLMEELAKHDVRWTFTMFVAPLSRHDYEYNTVLLQRAFDRGAEIENHTLRHNPDGRAVWASTDDQLRANIGGANNWLRTHIMGLDKIYRWKGGGGGFRRPGDPKRTKEEVNKIAAEGCFSKDIKSTLWPGIAKIKPDLYAPPYHLQGSGVKSEPIPLQSVHAISDLYTEFDYDTPEEGIRAYVASFDFWYYNLPEKVFIMRGHDWPNSPIPIRVPGHVNHWKILSGFIKEVLLNRKDRYPYAHSMTELELAYIFQGKATLSELLNREFNLQARKE